MRPSWRPGVEVRWRRVDAVQLSSGARSQLVTGLPLGSALLFRLLDGTHDLAELTALVAHPTHFDESEVHDVLKTLIGLDVIYDAAALPRLDAVEPHTRHRLRDEALSWVAGTDPALVLDRRRHTHVRVLSCDPVGVATALLLAASGVGRFSVSPASGEPDLVEAADILPGGLGAAVLGTPRSAAVRTALADLGADVRPHRSRAGADFAIAATPGSGSTRAGSTPPDIPHLTTEVSGRTALVGPLVIPGVTACGVCEAMSREDRDAALLHDHTESVATQLHPSAHTATVIQLAATHAAVAALELIDGSVAGRLPALAGHVLRIEVPGPVLLLSLVKPHPRCGCCWDAA